MAAITPTVQKVTNGLRGLVKSIVQNRKIKHLKTQKTSADGLHAQAETPTAEVKSQPARAHARPHSPAKAKSARATSAKSSHKKAAKRPAKKSASAVSSRSKSASANEEFRVSALPNTAVIPESNKDLAHKPGHQKMNLKAEFTERTGKKGKSQNSKALNYMSGSDKVHRTTSPHRRIINGSGTLGAKSPQGRSRKAH